MSRVERAHGRVAGGEVRDGSRNQSTESLGSRGQSLDGIWKTTRGLGNVLVAAAQKVGEQLIGSAPSEEHGALDFRLVSSSPALGIEIT